MLVSDILEEVLKLKRVVEGVGKVFYNGLQDISWGCARKKIFRTSSGGGEGGGPFKTWKGKNKKSS